MSGWDVSVVGAFDRFNYGDVLFARLAPVLLGPRLSGPGPGAPRFFFHGLRRADLSAEGGVPVRPLREIYGARPGREGRDHLVFLAGGALLAPSWGHMVQHILPPRTARGVKRVQDRIGRARLDPLWRRALGCPNRQPWTVDPRDLTGPGRVAVAYNAVGGIGLEGLSPDTLAWQREALARADWLTVRDGRTADSVEARGLPRPAVIPDSAVTMDDLVDAAALREGRARALALAGSQDGAQDGAPYLALQIAERRMRGQAGAIAARLRELHAGTGLDVLSFAIGRAPGHEDQIASERLLAELGDAPWFRTVREPLDVTGIMTLIAGAACYAGTSLHGFITAFAFGVPRVGLLAEIDKLTGFRDDWDLPAMPAGMPFEAIPEAVRTAMAQDRALTAERHRAARETYLRSLDGFCAGLRRKGEAPGPS